MVDTKKKVKELTDLATGSIFFPFTEPTVHSPVSGKKVSGRKMRPFNVKEKIWGETK